MRLLVIYGYILTEWLRSQGTVRFNLDPWGRHSDAEIEEVLAAVQLKDAALGGDGSSGGARGLAAEVSESGANLSVGQRQLLSLARAMLKNSPLILMDEATANVDFQTDAVSRYTRQSAVLDQSSSGVN